MYHKPIINHSYWSYQIITVATSGLQLFQIQKENGICPKMAKDIGEDQAIFDQVLEANGCGMQRHTHTLDQ